MNPGPSSARPLTDALQQHGAALRRLAAHLVGGAHADDVFQETAATALQERREVAQPLAFLRRVVRHLAGKHHRRAVRRQRREAAARGGAEVASPVELAAQREAIDRLHAALMAVPEPARGALLLRYFEDLSPPQIAARLGVPLPTVKSRLARGLELLRQRLGEDERDWRAGLAAAFGLHGELTKAATVGVAGVMGMAMTSKVLIAAAAAAVLTWWVWPEVAPPDAVVRQDVAVGAPVRDAGGAVGETSVTGNVERVSVAADAVAAALPRKWPAPATVRGRCVDEFGKPLAGCRVVWNGMRNNEEEFSKWVRTHYDPQWQNPPAQVTGEDGTFEWVVVPHEPLRFLLAVHCPGRVEMRREWNSRSRGDGLEPGATVALGDVVVAKGCEFSGRVVDTAGQPVAGVTCWLSADPVPAANGVHASGQFAGTTDSAGLFGDGSRLPAGTYEVGVSNRLIEEGAVWHLDGASPWHEVKVAVLAAPEAGRVIRGVVTDESGRQVRGVDVIVETQGVRTALECTADGAFEVVLAEGREPAPIDVSAWRRGYERGLVRGIKWGTSGLRIELRRAVDVELRVRDAAGRPVEEFAAWLAPGPAFRSWSSREGQIAAFGLQPGGVVNLEGVRRGAHLLLVEPRDRERLCTSAIVAVDVLDPSPCRIDLQLPQVARRTVRVVAAEGPVVGAEVQLIECDGSVEDAKVLSVEAYFQTYYQGTKALLRQTAITDAKGEVELSGPGGHCFTVRVPGGASLPAEVADVDLEAAEPLVVKVHRGASLRVQFLPAGIGKLLAGYARYGDEPPVGGAPERARIRLVPDGKLSDKRFAQLMDESDRVEFHGVAPGAWCLRWEFHQAIAAGGSSVFGCVTLAEVAGLGASESRDLKFDLSALVPGTLEAIVLHDGKPVRNQHVRIVGHCDSFADLSSQVTLQTDDQGALRWPVVPGTLRVEWPSRSAESVVVPSGGTATATFTLPSLPAR